MKNFCNSNVHVHMINRPTLHHAQASQHSSIRWHLFPVLYICHLAAETPHTKTHQHMLTHLQIQMDVQGCAMTTLSSAGIRGAFRWHLWLQSKKILERLFLSFFDRLAYPSSLVFLLCLGLCYSADGQMCFEIEVLAVTLTSTINCLKLKFIICELWPWLTSCCMERSWKK